MRKILLTLVMGLAALASAFAQHRDCAAETVLQQQLNENPLMRQVRDEIERHTENFIANGGATDRAVVTIPVVVHVVYFNSTQNISDAAILSQIQVLNDDFRRLNADRVNTPSAFTGVAADCEVNFCMAQRTPTGAATNGIVRVQTTVNGFSTNDAVKYTAQGGSNIWDRNQYLNLWVCNLTGGLLGYAQFPGGPAATDGVVCDYAYFGTVGSTAPFNLGRTATHEVGHWLNCFHIWGDDGTACTGTDQVADTPNQADENYGCPTFPQVSCSNGPNGDMFMNYMDYTDDGCMNLFTTGQKSRMQALFATGGARASLTTSQGCVPPSSGSCGTPTGLAASNITSTSATLGWTAVSGATAYNLQWKTNAATTWNTVSNLTTTSYNLSGLTASTLYNFKVQAVCGTTNGTYSTAVNFTTLAAGSCGTPTGLTATNVGSNSATLGWGAVTGATAYNVQWKASTATTWTTVSGLTTTSYALSALAPGTTYNFQVQAVCGTTSGAYSTAASFTTTASNCSNLYEPNEARTTAKVIPVNTDILTQIATATDKDWYKFANTSATRNIKVDLTTLPADYDLELWRSSTRLLTSTNSGTTAEQIKLNTTTVSTSYYAYVYGYQSANSTSCYTLRVSLSSSAWRTDGTTDGDVQEFELPAEFVNLSFGMFPNPAADQLTIEVPVVEESDVMVNIFDIAGKAVAQQNRKMSDSDNLMQFDLAHMANGVYMVQVRNGEQTSTRKLVVQK